MPEKKVEELSEEERNYLYFKIHDLDGNDKLDGLEMFYSATHHHSVSEDEHAHDSDGHEHQNEHDHDNNHNTEANTAVSEPTEDHDSANGQPSNDSTANSDASNHKVLELAENGQIVNKNFNHIIGLYF